MYFVRMPSANAHGCVRVFNEGNFVAKVFDVCSNNKIPIT
jgi:murein L,D-transpeptidase YcbB/YkuD